mgnify:FL=1
MSKILSIIIPTYNAEKFLNKGLSSFLVCRDTDAQTARHNCKMATEGRFEEIDIDKAILDKLEVIVVNDGTPDRSVEVAQKFVDWYPDTFAIVNKTNGGHGSAINTGVEHVSGKYFKVVDADDWVDTLALKKLITTLQILEAAQEKQDTRVMDAMLMSYTTYDLQKAAKGDIPYEEHIVVPGTKHDKSVDIQNLGGPYSSQVIAKHFDDVYWGLTFHGILYNTAFYRGLAHKLAEGIFYEDQEYAAVPMAYADTIYVYDEQLYQYRIGDVSQSISMESSLKRLSHYETVIRTLIAEGGNSEEFAPGGKQIWGIKTAKFIDDYYQLCLIKNPDKKMLRDRMEKFTSEIKSADGYIYGLIEKNYKVFRLLNRLHMNEKVYQKVFIPMVHLIRK